jgi:hypothetical protein
MLLQEFDVLGDRPGRLSDIESLPAMMPAAVMNATW